MDTHERNSKSSKETGLSGHEMSKLILKYSIDDVLESKFLKHNVLKFIHDDVDIYPGKLEIAIQMYESTTDFKTLNKANTLEEYEEVFASIATCSGMKSLEVYMYFLEKVRNIKVFKSEKRFIVFPIHTMFIDNYKKKIKFAGHHASLCILDQGQQSSRSKTSKAYIIDSDNITNRNKNFVYSEQKYEDYLCEKVKYQIMSKIHGLKILKKNKISVEFLDVKTPQSITKDDYCLFWSLALTEELLNSLSLDSASDEPKDKEFNPSEILEKFMKKYKSKKKLENYIIKYILSHF